MHEIPTSDHFSSYLCIVFGFTIIINFIIVTTVGKLARIGTFNGWDHVGLVNRLDDEDYVPIYQKYKNILLS